MQLILKSVSYTYPASVEPAVRNVSVVFSSGWTGVVGDNGSGKTTLALIACGIIAPDTGSVSPSLVSAYCAQDATVAPSRLFDFACAYDALSVRLRLDLDIADEWPWRYGTLSGGQQKRLQVACALWEQPDVLVLDEPTNHVDAATREAITRALRRFTGIGVLISHDRTLLDDLCRQCLFVGAGRALTRPGTYSQASAQASLERRSALSERDKARRERKRLEREAQRRREEASRAKGKRSLKGAGARDADARHKVRVAVVSGKDGQAGRLSARMGTRLARTDEHLAQIWVEKRYDADIWLDAAPSRRPVLVRLEATTIAMGEASLVVPDLIICNTDHVALVGENGSGKTTLVKHLVTRIPTGVRWTYVPQEPTAEQRRAARQRLDELGAAERGRALSIVALLNSEPERVLEGSEMSPGELRKLMLALGILDEPELIVMDEPTNHLDLGSVEALERLLAGYPGALLLVSHDAGLTEAATDICWACQRVSEGIFELTVR